MSTGPTKEMCEQLYAGKAPWDIGKPQPAFVAHASQVTGSVLDAGCGTGEHALFFASRGHAVTGIDFLSGPIAQACQKSVERGINATFFVMDALALSDLKQRFDSAIDSGLFHGFTDEQRKQYITALSAVVKPGGKVFLMCFSDDEPGTEGPRRITQKELRDSFTSGWVVESIEPTQFEVVPDLKGFTFSEGGPKAWFATIRRVG